MVCVWSGGGGLTYRDWMGWGTWSTMTRGRRWGKAWNEGSFKRLCSVDEPVAVLTWDATPLTPSEATPHIIAAESHSKEFQSTFDNQKQNKRIPPEEPLKSSSLWIQFLKAHANEKANMTRFNVTGQRLNTASQRRSRQILFLLCLQHEDALAQAAFEEARRRTREFEDRDRSHREDLEVRGSWPWNWNLLPLALLTAPPSQPAQDYWRKFIRVFWESQYWDLTCKMLF